MVWRLGEYRVDMNYYYLIKNPPLPPPPQKKKKEREKLFPGQVAILHCFFGGGLEQIVGAVLAWSFHHGRRCEKPMWPCARAQSGAKLLKLAEKMRFRV